MQDRPNWKPRFAALAVLLFSIAAWFACVVVLVVVLRRLGVIQ